MTEQQILELITRLEQQRTKQRSLRTRLTTTIKIKELKSRLRSMEVK